MKYITFKVHMHAFANGKIREVDVPEENITSEQNHNLSMIYHYGQNDFQPKQLPSVSVGDIIEYEGKYFAVVIVGFKEVESHDTELSFSELYESNQED